MLKYMIVSLLTVVQLFGGWSEIQNIVEGSGDGSLSYGYSTAKGDNFTVIGAPNEYDGAIYILKAESDGKLQAFAKIEDQDDSLGLLEGYTFGGFGVDVDIVGDFIVVGAPRSTYRDGKFTAKKSAVLVYKLNDTKDDFIREKYFIADEHNTIGTSVAIGHHHGLVERNEICEGSYCYEVPVYGPITVVATGSPMYSGVTTYSNADDHDEWKAHSVFGHQETGDAFGYSIALDDEGVKLIVGAPGSPTTWRPLGSDPVTYEEKGIANIYKLSGDYVDGYVWDNAETLYQNYSFSNEAGKTYDTHSGFGHSVDMHNDRVIVGALYEHNALKDKATGEPIIFGGEARIFELTDSENNTWSRMDTIEGSSVNSGSDGYAKAVSIFGDLAFVGAPTYSNGEISSGAVFSYNYNGSDWLETGAIIPETAGALGQSVDHRGDTLYVGDPENDSLGVYQYRDMSFNPAIIMYILD